MFTVWVKCLASNSAMPHKPGQFLWQGSTSHPIWAKAQPHESFGLWETIRHVNSGQKSTHPTCFPRSKLMFSAEWSVMPLQYRCIHILFTSIHQIAEMANLILFILNWRIGWRGIRRYSCLSRHKSLRLKALFAPAGHPGTYTLGIIFNMSLFLRLQNEPLLQGIHHREESLLCYRCSDFHLLVKRGAWARLWAMIFGQCKRACHRLVLLSTVVPVVVHSNQSLLPFRQPHLYCGKVRFAWER